MTTVRNMKRLLFISILLISIVSCFVFLLASQWQQEVVQLVPDASWTYPSEPFNESLCSAKATARGPHQRVVTYSFFGPVTHDRMYFFGIAYNAEDLPRMYPNWTMRVYHAIRADDFVWPTLAAWEKAFPHLDLCNASALPVLGNVVGPEPMTWRFMPMGDPLVDVFITRDLESFSLPREVAAVAEWMASNLTFHVMRDTWGHERPMLGGMWGAKRYREPKLLTDLFLKVSEKAKHKGPPGYDQHILRDVVWPAIKGNVMQHDSYYCQKFHSHGHMRPFPIRRKDEDNNYIGFKITYLNNSLRVECPVACRPVDHKDWKTC